MHIDTITARGFTIRVGTTSVPGSRRPLLLFNGIGASLELVVPFVEAMQRAGIPCIVFDIPGVGGSGKNWVPYRFPSLARIADAVLRQLGVHGPVDVLSVSWGGALAQQFAKDFPERCNKLVLAATSPGAIMVPGRLRAMLKMVSPRRYTDPKFMSHSARHLYGGDFRNEPALSESLLRNMEPPTSLGYVMQLLAATGWTSIHWLHRLRQPTLVLVGTDDPIVPPINGRILAAVIPNARLVAIDCGHLFLLTRPDQLSAIIRSFLDGTPAEDDVVTPS